MDKGTISRNRGKAQHLLLAYLNNAAKGASPYDDGDYRTEVAEIVDLIVEAAKQEMRYEMTVKTALTVGQVTVSQEELAAWKEAIPAILEAKGCTRSCGKKKLDAPAEWTQRLAQLEERTGQQMEDLHERNLRLGSQLDGIEGHLRGILDILNRGAVGTVTVTVTAAERQIRQLRDLEEQADVDPTLFDRIRENAKAVADREARLEGRKIDPRAEHDDHPESPCNCPACR